MTTTTLSFGTTKNLLEFITHTEALIIKMEKQQRLLTAHLTEREIELACNAFDAKICTASGK